MTPDDDGEWTPGAKNWNPDPPCASVTVRTEPDGAVPSRAQCVETDAA